MDWLDLFEAYLDVTRCSVRCTRDTQRRAACAVQLRNDTLLSCLQCSSRASVACPHRASICSAQRSLLPPVPPAPPSRGARAPRPPPARGPPPGRPPPGAGLCRAPPARSPVSHVLSRKAAASRATRFVLRAIL